MQKTITAAVLLAATATLAHAQTTTQSTTQLQTQEMLQNREAIYRGDLMSEQERQAYMERLRQAKTEQERERIRLEHREQMDQRVRALNQNRNTNSTGQGGAPGAGASKGGGGGGGGALPPPVDSQSPTLLQVEVRDIGASSASIYWRTNEEATARVRFGLSSNHEKGDLPDNRLQTSGSFALDGLLPGSRYYFRLVVTDAVGNQTISESFFDTKAGAEEDDNGTCARGADINGDRRVNLIDFSILLFNWNNLINQKADLNCDGRVDLADFSILLYYWQG